MKSIVLFIFSFTLVLAAAGQLTKGQWIVGGTGDFSHSKSDATYNGVAGGDSKNTQYSVSAGAGYFFKSRLCAGLRLGVGGLKIHEDFENSGFPYYFAYTTKSKINSFNISPFIRYYLLQQTQKVNLLAEVAYVYTNGKSRVEMVQAIEIGGNPPTVTQSVNSAKINSNSFSVAAGPAFFLNPKVSLEVTLKYSISKQTDVDGTGNAFGVGAGFQIHLGK